MDREYILAIKSWSIEDDSGWHPNWRLARATQSGESSSDHSQNEPWCPVVVSDLDAYFFGECVAIHRFEDMKLPERNFAAQILVAANFARAVLDYTDFSFAAASMSNFSETHLFSARFIHAQLVFADFTAANLQQANFSGADLCYANFKYATLKDTLLRDACLEKANFNETDLRGADLRGVEIRGANWKDGVFSDRTILPFDFDRAVSLGMIYHPESYMPSSEWKSEVRGQLHGPS